MAVQRIQPGITDLGVAGLRSAGEYNKYAPLRCSPGALISALSAAHCTTLYHHI